MTDERPMTMGDIATLMRTSPSRTWADIKSYIESFTRPSKIVEQDEAERLLRMEIGRRILEHRNRGIGQ
jgi:hypothetical protein